MSNTKQKSIQRQIIEVVLLALLVLPSVYFIGNWIYGNSANETAQDLAVQHEKEAADPIGTKKHYATQQCIFTLENSNILHDPNSMTLLDSRADQLNSTMYKVILTIRAKNTLGAYVVNNVSCTLKNTQGLKQFDIVSIE